MRTTTDLLLPVYESGLTFSQYQTRMTVFRQAMADHLAALRLPAEDAADLAQVTDPRRVLVLTEDWCGDSMLNLPILARVLEAMPDAEARIVKREEHWELARRYPAADGNNHIPLLIFMTPDGHELGHWMERSAAAHDWDRAYRAQKPPPPKFGADGQKTPAWESWNQRRLARARRAYHAGLWLAAVAEFKALLGAG